MLVSDDQLLNYYRWTIASTDSENTYLSSLIAGRPRRETTVRVRNPAIKDDDI